MKYIPSQITNQRRNRYLDHLIDPSFQGVNRLFVLSFKDNNGRESQKQYYLPTVEIKDYNAAIDGSNVFEQSIKNNFKRYDNNTKISTG